MPKKAPKKQAVDVQALADELGALRAAESDMQARDKAITAALIDALGAGGEAEG